MHPQRRDRARVNGAAIVALSGLLLTVAACGRPVSRAGGVVPGIGTGQGTPAPVPAMGSPIGAEASPVAAVPPRCREDTSGLPPDKRAFVEREVVRCATAQALPTAPKYPVTPLPLFETPTTAPATLTAVARLRHCRAGDLTVIWGGITAATGGTLLGRLLFGNRSATPCRLMGVPDIRLFDAQGEPIVPRLLPCVQGTPDGGVPWTCAPARPVPLAPGVQPRPYGGESGTVAVLLIWNVLKPDHTGTCVPPPPAAASVRVVLPEGGEELAVAVPTGEVEPLDPLGLAACSGRLWVSSFFAR